MKLKQYVNEEDLLFEEITIGKIENKYIISVYTEPLGNPSFHIKNKTGELECVYQIKDFRLLEKKTKDEFTSKELKLFSNFFKEENKHYSGFTNWQVLLRQWNIINPKYEISTKVEQPEF
jgi:hypothetical protein